MLTAQFVNSANVVGPASLPALLTLDTTVAVPVITGLVSDTGSSSSDKVSQVSAVSTHGTDLRL